MIAHKEPITLECKILALRCQDSMSTRNQSILELKSLHYGCQYLILKLCTNLSHMELVELQIVKLLL